MSDSSRRQFLTVTLPAAAASAAIPGAAFAQVTAFKQAVAEAAGRDTDIAAFYKANGYQPIWTGKGNRDKTRRTAFLKAVAQAGNHGLPTSRYNPEMIKTNVRRVESERDLGRLEVELSKLFLTYARDIQTGMLTPSEVDRQIVRDIPLRNRTAILTNFAKSSPNGFIKALAPKSQEYAQLMKEKLRLEKVAGSGGWGPKVQAGKLSPGQSSQSVIALRNRLIRMGYLRRNASQSFDANMQKAVQLFQQDHGLTPDGVAGESTISEVNQTVATRLSQVMVAMERERWINTPGGRGKRHVWVNMTDFRTKIYDNGKVTFETRSVIGERRVEKRSPEFSDAIQYMEVNPDWTVPRSILGRDYLPKLKQNPYAASYLQLIDVRGRIVSRDAIDFSRYTEKNFPFTVRQPPGRSNALGTVKFMFPNPHAIYLHDTPARKLFQREVRAFSSGCIRLMDPHDFAYKLLEKQMSNGKEHFDRVLNTGKQTIVPLDVPVPVHLDYRTAFTEPRRKTQFRRDIYGRDAKIFAAMRQAGVSLRSVQG